MKQILLQSDLQPEGLLSARKNKLSWEEFSKSEEGHQLRRAKAEEQKGVCGYCECLLWNETGDWMPGGVHIDHFWPRNRGKQSRPDLTFEWDNMILSCNRESTCGKHKDRQDISSERLLNPHKHDPRSFITFIQDTSSKKYGGCSLLAHPRPELSQQDRELSHNTIEAFKLNDPGLLDIRSKALLSEKYTIDELVELLEKVPSEGSEMKNEIIENMQQILRRLECQPFSSALLAYAQEKFSLFITEF